jgi:hypothetical protein
MTRRLIDLTGQRFGRWTVLAIHPERYRRPHGKAVSILCLSRCDCGTERVVRADVLRVGRSRSCGCLQRELSRELLRKRNTKHGLSRTSAYDRYINILQRCRNPNHPHYDDYGGRGIGVDWQSFEEYFADVGHAPDGLSLDRPDNNRSYGPSNWRWATHSEQMRNRRPSKKNKLRIKRGDPKILAGLKQLNESLTKART